MTKDIKQIQEENRKLKSLIYKASLAIIDLLEQHTQSEAGLQLFDDGLSANEHAIGFLHELGIVKNNKIDFNQLEKLK